MAQRRNFADGVVKAMVSALPPEAEKPEQADVLPGYGERHRPTTDANKYTKAINVLLTPALHLGLTLAAQMIAKDAPKPTQDELVRYAISQTYGEEYATAKRILEVEE